MALTAAFIIYCNEFLCIMYPFLSNKILVVFSKYKLKIDDYFYVLAFVYWKMVCKKSMRHTNTIDKIVIDLNW